MRSRRGKDKTRLNIWYGGDRGKIDGIRIVELREQFGCAAWKWVCAPGCSLGPYTTAPPDDVTSDPNYCGQCVSYVKRVCPSLPQTSKWIKGLPVKDNKNVVEGTVIATFNESGKYWGHAAIYVSQNDKGIDVYDQWITPPGPKAVGPRTLRWGAHGIANNGDGFYVVE